MLPDRFHQRLRLHRHETVDRLLLDDEAQHQQIPELLEGSRTVMAADGVAVLDHRVKDAGAQQLHMADRRLMNVRPSPRSSGGVTPHTRRLASSNQRLFIKLVRTAAVGRTLWAAVARSAWQARQWQTQTQTGSADVIAVSWPQEVRIVI